MMALDPRLFDEGDSPRVFTSPRVSTSLSEPQDLPPLAPEPSTAQRIGKFLQQRLAPVLGDVGSAMHGEPFEQRPSNVMRRQRLEEQDSRIKRLPMIMSVAKFFQDSGIEPEKSAPFLSGLLKESGFEFDDEFSRRLVTTPDLSELIMDTYKEDLEHLSPAARVQAVQRLNKIYRQDPKALFTAAETRLKERREGKKQKEQEKETRRKFALEQGYPTEEAEVFAKTGQLPAGVTPKFTREKEKAEKESPTAEKDLEAEATRRRLTGQAKFDFKQQERIKLAGGKAEAIKGGGIEAQKGAPLSLSELMLIGGAEKQAELDARVTQIKQHPELSKLPSDQLRERVKQTDYFKSLTEFQKKYLFDRL